MTSLQDMAKLYAQLITIAKQQGTISYSDAGQLVGLGTTNVEERNEMSHLLEYISRAEAAEGRPMLSSVVIYKSGEGPGRGFFTLARQLKRARNDEDNTIVHARELKATHEAWKLRQEGKSA